MEHFASWSHVFLSSSRRDIETGKTGTSSDLPGGKNGNIMRSARSSGNPGAIVSLPRISADPFGGVVDLRLIVAQ